jgi:hypothetical protein
MRGIWDLYQNSGLQIIAQQKSEEDLQPLLAIIALNQERYLFKESNLSTKEADEKKIAALGQGVTDKFQKQIDELKRQQVVVQGRIASPERSADLTLLQNGITALEKLRAAMISSLEEAMRSRKKQQQLLQKIHLFELGKKSP